MRIGLFTDAYLPDVNGVVSSIKTLKDALTKLGHEAYVITNHNKMSVELSDDKVLRLPGLEIKKLYGYKLSSPIQITGYEMVKQLNLDVIHVHTEIGIGLFARICAKRLDIPVIYTYHTMYEDYIHYINPKGFESIDQLGRKVVRSLSKIAGNGPQAVIAPSNKTKKALQRYGVKTPIYVVPTGLDLSEFDRSNLDEARIQAIRQPYPGPTIVYLGRVAKEKALEIPIEAMRYVHEMDLIVVGDGPDRPYYEKLAQSLGVQDHVHFLGRVDKEEVPYYYHAFDGFVSASLSETQGMTYIEALASGLVLFVRKDEVLTHLVDEEKTGYYFEDAKQLASQWERFFARNDRDAYRQECIEKTKMYDPSLFAQKVVAVYEQAISDYQDAYVITKIRYVKAGFSQVTFSKQNQSISIDVAEDEIIDQHLMVGARIDRQMVRLFLSLENYYIALAKAQAKLARAAYSTHQMKEYCLYKLDLDVETTQEVLGVLAKKGLLNDERFAQDRANYYYQLGRSPKQISQKLFQAGISTELIDQAMANLTNYDQSALRLAKRLMKSASVKVVFEKLLGQGYSMEEAKRACELAESKEDQARLLQKTLAKAFRLYHKDMYKIREYCMKKGFSTTEIDQALEQEAKHDS